MADSSARAIRPDPAELQGLRSCAAANSFAPPSAHTAILPLLNGMAHWISLGAVSARRRPRRPIVISMTLDTEGRIIHLNDTHFLSFGELTGPTHAPRRSPRRWRPPASISSSTPRSSRKCGKSGSSSRPSPASPPDARPVGDIVAAGRRISRHRCWMNARRLPRRKVLPLVKRS